MICVHLKKLYHLCQDEGIRVSSSDLVQFVCNECGVKEVCPSSILDEELVDLEVNEDQTSSE